MQGKFKASQSSFGSVHDETSILFLMGFLSGTDLERKGNGINKYRTEKSIIDGQNYSLLVAFQVLGFGERFEAIS
jgi:hypothetical protein